MSSNPHPGFDLDEHFEKLAETYEELAVCVKDVSQDLIKLAPPLTKDSVVHDNGCGPGITVGEILKLDFSDGLPTIYATDYSPAMIRKVKEKEWKDVREEVMNSEDLKFPSDTFTHSFASLLFMAVNDPDKVASEIYRTLKPGGTTFATIWETFGWLPVAHAAQKSVKPQAPLFPSPVSREWQTESRLRSCLQSGGFQADDIEIKRSKVTAYMKDMVSGMDHFVEAVTMMVAQGWTPEESEKLAAELRRGFDYKTAKPPQFDFYVLIAIAKK